MRSPASPFIARSMTDAARGICGHGFVASGRDEHHPKVQGVAVKPEQTLNR